MPFIAFSQQVIEKKQPHTKKEDSIVVNRLSFSSDKNNAIVNEEEYRKFYQIPEDFPHFSITGDPITDEKNYMIAKEQWLKLHPAIPDQNKIDKE